MVNLEALNNKAAIIAQDGQYLGTISDNRFSDDSIANPYGQYGSRYSPLSIFNPYGQYGSEFSPLSPWNSYTTTPPSLKVRGQFVANLTVNPYLSPSVHPNRLMALVRH